VLHDPRNNLGRVLPGLLKRLFISAGVGIGREQRANQRHSNSVFRPALFYVASLHSSSRDPVTENLVQNIRHMSQLFTDVQQYMTPSRTMAMFPKIDPLPSA
jgi:hypothetical protein